jgi:hypothetical protein
MNYEFDLEEWLPRFSLKELHGHYYGNDITSPCDICNNELLRRGMKDQFEWGEPVPVDIFVHSIGEPDNRSATKIGGLPYRSDGLSWPKTASGRSMALIAQFNFTNSADIVGKLPGDLLLVFGDDSDGPIDPLHFEWQNLDQADLVTHLPSDSMAISPCFGNRCRTVSFPSALLIDRGTAEPKCYGKEVWSSYWIPTYQATQIGRAPFFIQEGDDGLPGIPLCTIASVQPDAHSIFPWVNQWPPLCKPNEWPREDDNLMINDLGCIYIFIDEDGEIHARGSSY